MKIIEQDLIELQLTCADKKAAIQQLAQRLQQAGRVAAGAEFVAAVEAREELSSTGIGFGLAIPHGRSAAVRTASVAFGRSQAGLDWQAHDGEPVQLVFLIAVPQQAADNQHLKILAVLSRKLMHEAFRRELLECSEPTAVLDVLQEVLKQAECVA